MLQSHDLHIDDNHVDYPRNAMHVYATNEHCVIWNNKMLEYIDSEIYACLAYDSKKDGHTNVVSINFSANPHKTSNLLKVLNVKVGSRAMLATNIDVTDGLTNGVIGTFTNVIEIPKYDLNNVINVIVVQFDNSKIGCDAIGSSQYKHINADAVLIK